MNASLEIARAATLRPITEIAAELGLSPEDLELYGRYKAKISTPALNRLLADNGRQGKIVLVTAITPTPAGEGKTTTTIGLAQGLCRLGKRAVSATREPSMGPVFGIKGGA
ncbi:MAG TPA: formate--tetrahydrofolate ligase, partial [Chthonomonadaceae bacterium]|nr:formate--tetrahydrofolate ligase [Chthonomonadaceae bacterium]